MLSCGFADEEFRQQIKPLLNQYCVDCHSGDAPDGDIDFESIDTLPEIEQHYQVWARAVELVELGQMPPDDQPRPTDTQRERLKTWHRANFVDNVQARAGVLRPRRLSATEYRNTLRSLFGFDLELAIVEAEQTRVDKSLVMKLLPTDPPGKSGFRNDTHSNPLTTAVWDQYSYLVDYAIEDFFSETRLPQREVYLGSRESEFPSSPLTADQAERLIRSFVPRAFRRHPPKQKLDEMVQRIRASEDVEAATKVELKVALMSPAFLYRGLLAKGQPGKQQPVDDFELAERLSYFLWADMPDAELMNLAAKGTLHGPRVFDTQVQRMLDSPKAINLANDFAVQWLALDDIEQASDETPYMLALKAQPIDFINFLFVEDRPLLELIDSRITFANLHTRKFYPADSKQLLPHSKRKGIEKEAVPNQKIRLEQTAERGGILTMPGIVAMNRGPIIRGTWILERILGEPLPDPPANVGQVPPNRSGQRLTFRERFEQHRSNSTCATCHDKIDPLGFALQAYDRDGVYVLAKDYKPPRKRKNADDSHEVARESLDASGQLPSGEQFEDFQGLKRILVTTQRDRVMRNIVSRLLAYALCRKLEYYDQPTVDSILQELESTGGTYRDLVREITHSLPFRESYVPGGN
jgi:hypothetical protein